MQIDAMVRQQREYFNAGHTLSLEARQTALAAFYEAVQNSTDAIAQALRADLNRPEFESYATETGLLLAEIRSAKKHLKAWAKARGAGMEILNFPARNKIYPEPLGLTLIMAPWNYPVQLSLLPLATAVAAGNCVIVKPSRRTPASAAVIAKIVAAAFDPRHVAVFSGQGDDYAGILKERFDFILYTGSARVGRIVMRAAAEHLTPVCLELGGKSPAVVMADANLDLAAKRIAWGKTLNAGQTCVAPDYVLAERSIKQELEVKLEKWFTVFAGENPLQNPDYGAIVSASAFDRLVGLSPRPLKADKTTLKIAPVLLPDTQATDLVMQEEIFGPLLPVLAFDAFEQAVQFVNNRPKPLAFYLFTSNKRTAAEAMRRIPFGGGCINDTIMHVASHRLPFGGVGESGMGRYHGKAGFDLFSNLKGVVEHGGRIDMPMRYPPGNKKRLGLIKKILR